MWAEYIRMEGTEFLIEKTSTSMIASIISNLTSSSGIDINDKINSCIRIKIITLTKSETESIQINKNNNNGVELLPPENKNEDPFHLFD